MANSINLNERLPANTFIYVGQRQLRHDSEPNLKKEEMLEQVPEAYPHTFIDFSGAKLSDVLEHAGGKQGCVVDTQKVVRDKSSKAEVQAWRRFFDPEMLKSVIQKAEKLDESTALRMIYTVGYDEDGEICDPDSEEAVGTVERCEPYVVIKFATAGSALDVPKQPVDKLNAIKENAKAIYDAMLANLDEEQQLEEASRIYDQLSGMDL